MYSYSPVPIITANGNKDTPADQAIIIDYVNMAIHTQVSLVGDVDRAKQVPTESIYQEHVNSIPSSNRYKKLDFESGNLDKHLEKIADSMINWSEKLLDIKLTSKEKTV